MRSCDQLWIVAECPERLVIVQGISNAAVAAEQNTIGREREGGGGAGVRGREAADYPRKASVFEGQKLEGLKHP